MSSTLQLSIIRNRRAGTATSAASRSGIECSIGCWDTLGAALMDRVSLVNNILLSVLLESLRLLTDDGSTGRTVTRRCAPRSSRALWREEVRGATRSELAVKANVNDGAVKRKVQSTDVENAVDTERARLVQGRLRHHTLWCAKSTRRCPTSSMAWASHTQLARSNKLPIK